MPPPDFVPSDTGVGVALPPENEGGPNASSTPNIKTNPFKEFLFDEEKFIQEMENFHSERRAELFGPRVPPPPRIPTNPLTKLPHVEPQVEPQVQPQVVATPLPIVWKSSTTATSPPIARSSPNTTPPATPPVTTPSKGFYVSTATPSSFSFLYHNENNENNYIRNNHHSPKPVARSTTTPPSTTIATAPPPPPPTPSPSTIAPTHFPPIGKPPAQQLQTTTATPPTVRQLKPRLEKQRGPKSFFHVEQNFGQKISNINEIDIDNKVAEERHDHFFKRWPGTPKVTITKPFSEIPIGAPFRSNRRKSKSGGGLFHPGPTLASTVISSLKPRHALSRFGLHRPAPYQQQQHYQQAAVPPPPHSTRAGSSHAQQLHHHQHPPYARRRLPHPLPPRAGSLHAQQLSPPLLPPQQEQPPALRRSSNGDHRYVSFHIGHRGKIGGQSWGYSYRL